MAASPKPTSSTKRRTTKRKAPTTTTATNTTATTVSPLLSAITNALTSSRSFFHNHDLYLLPNQSHSLQSSLSSAFLSLSKLQSLLHHQPHFQLPHFPSSYSWFQRFLLSSSGDDDSRWVDFFRMSKSTFYILNSTISDSVSSALPSSISPDFALGAALYKLAHDGSFSFVGKRFGLSSSDACRVFYTVCKVICDQLGGYVSGFGSEMGRILVGFEWISLINCCGVLGVEKFQIEGEMLGKNGFLMVQALVDSEGRFLDVSAGWPSTFNPDSVLRQTRLFLNVEESKELLNGPKIELIDGKLMPQYILGDSCYPCLPWLLTPYLHKGDTDDSSSTEKEFNEVHKRAMGFVRTAFGRIRANWQFLNRKWKQESVEFLPFIIITACVLNNFLLKHGEMLSEDDQTCVREQGFPVFDGDIDESAARNRDLLALHLSRVRQDNQMFLI